MHKSHLINYLVILHDFFLKKNKKRTCNMPTCKPGPPKPPEEAALQYTSRRGVHLNIVYASSSSFLHQANSQEAVRCVVVGFHLSYFIRRNFRLEAILLAWQRDATTSRVVKIIFKLPLFKMGAEVKNFLTNSNLAARTIAPIAKMIKTVTNGSTQRRNVYLRGGL